ncbi:MAG: MBL fold metallo-hydrolase [Kofleriaceae bacterium]
MKLAPFAMALVACSSPPSPVEPIASGDVRAQRFAIGAWTAYALDDGAIELPNDGKTFGLGHTPDEVAGVLAAGGAPRDTIHLDIHPLLVITDTRVLLFDTGAGDAPWAKGGKLLRALAATRVTPAQVTDIFVSHAHGDHVLGLVAGDALAFPSATIHISTLEWAFLQASEEDKALVAVIAPKVAAFEPGTAILPEVTAVDTRGHTPGHSSYMIGSGAESLFYLGDVAHHSILSVQRPQWSIEFDMDRPTAEARRQQTLAKLADDRTRVYAVHFPFPGLGRVERTGDVLMWRPE